MITAEAALAPVRVKSSRVNPDTGEWKSTVTNSTVAEMGIGSVNGVDTVGTGGTMTRREQLDSFHIVDYDEEEERYCHTTAPSSTSLSSG